MEKYIFSEDTVNKGYNAIFLCGIKYKKSQNDKRNILKEHLKTLDKKNKVIILEEIFGLENNSKKYLFYYDNVFVKDLNDIETATAMFSDKIMIIHEGISTGAELAMFATNKLLNSKICILVPHEYSIEENKITEFLQLAFFNDSNNVMKIKFYPEVEQWQISKFKSEFRTSFYNNKIGQNLSNQIQDFLQKNRKDTITIKFRKALFRKYNKSEEVISYIIDSQKNTLNVNISTEIIKTHIISMFNLREFRENIRKEKTLPEHVSYIEKCYKDVLLYSLSEKEGNVFKNIKLKFRDTSLEFREVIAYTLYLLQAMYMISIKSEKKNEKTKIKVIINNNFKNLYNCYASLIKRTKNEFFVEL